MKVVILAPSDSSLYSRIVVRRCLDEEDVRVAGIIMRKRFGPIRAIAEVRRRGPVFLRQVWQKCVIGNLQLDSQETRYSLRAYARRLNIENVPLSRLARDHNIPLCRTYDVNAERSIRFARKIGPTLVLSTGSGIIREPFLNVSGQGVLNAHPGILPQYRGWDTMQWALIESKDKTPELGLTLHYMDKGVDTGPILMVRKVSIQRDDTLKSLQEQYNYIMVEMMIAGVRMAREGTLRGRPQIKRDGRQFFLLHPALDDIAKKRVADVVARI